MLVGWAGLGGGKRKTCPARHPRTRRPLLQILLPCDALDPGPERRHEGHPGTRLSPMGWGGGEREGGRTRGNLPEGSKQLLNPQWEEKKSQTN